MYWSRETRGIVWWHNTPRAGRSYDSGAKLWVSRALLFDIYISRWIRNGDMSFLSLIDRHFGVVLCDEIHSDNICIEITSMKKRQISFWLGFQWWEISELNSNFAKLTDSIAMLMLIDMVIKNSNFVAKNSEKYLRWIECYTVWWECNIHIADMSTWFSPDYSKSCVLFAFSICSQSDL